MREADTSEPGLIMEDDGTIWLIAPGGARTQLPGAGAVAFSGARYPIDDLGNEFQVGSGDLGINLNNASAFYDTDGYTTFPGPASFDDNGHLVIPRDGYYRITASGRASFDAPGCDTTHVNVTIFSAARDGDWDQCDLFTIWRPTDSLEGGNGLTVTHWLAAGDDVSLYSATDGSVRPFFRAALEVVFAGPGPNPAA